MINFSKNKKLNNVLNTIYDEIKENLTLTDIKRYKETFKNEIDYNIYSYGNLRIYYEDIRELYKDYKSLKNASDYKLENIYKRQVGYITRYIYNHDIKRALYFKQF